MGKPTKKAVTKAKKVTKVKAKKNTRTKRNTKKFAKKAIKSTTKTTVVTTTTVTTETAPVAVKPVKTVVAFLLDESGSMGQIKSQTIQGFNSYLRTLKEKSGDLRFTLTKFNSVDTRVIYAAEPIASVKELNEYTFSPAGDTPLYDAIGRTIRALESRIKESGEEVAVIFAIMTDGQENSSHEFSSHDAKALIAEKTRQGWDFVYLGAEHNAYLASGQLGISAGNTVNYHGVNVIGTLAAVAHTTSRYASARAGGQSITRGALFDANERAVMESTTQLDSATVDTLLSSVTPPEGKTAVK